ncbi:Uncharacterised protein [Mycobacteroides abscessus]|nr:Uncharacterised protein [Mycobacteroides abscessus]
MLPRLVLCPVDDLARERGRGDLVGDEADERGGAAGEGLRQCVGAVAEPLDGLVHPSPGVLADARTRLVVHDVRDRGDRDARELRDVAHRDGRTVLAVSCRAHPLVAPLSSPLIIALFRTRNTSSNGVTVTHTAAKVAVQSVFPIAPM